MKALLRLGWRDLVRHRRFTLLFILNLTLGLCGVLLVTSFGASLARHFESHLKELLTADLMFQSARPLTGEELGAIGQLAGEGAVYSRQVSFFTMVRGQAASRLVQIMAIDASFPLYGSFRDADGRPIARAAAGLQQRRALLLSPETALGLGLALGDSVEIGAGKFTLAEVYGQDPGSETTALNFAPRLYLGLPQLEETGLLRFGSRVVYTTFVRLADSESGPDIAPRLRTALRALEGDRSEVRVITPQEASRRLGRVVDYFSSYLSLAALVALLLAGLNAAYLFREHLEAGTREIAILLSLGASRGRCLLLYAGELLVLGIVASLFTLGLVRLILPPFAALFSGLIPAGLNLGLDPGGVLLILAIATLGSPLFCLPLFLRILAVRPLALLSDQGREAIGEENRGPAMALARLAAGLPALALVLGLGIRVSHSPRLGLLLVGGLIGLLLLFSLAARLLARLCRHWSATGTLVRRLVLRSLYRSRRPAGAMLVAMAAALLLVSLVPQVEKGLVEEVSRPRGLIVPDLFLIDIQEGQQQPLEDFFRGQGVTLSPLAPMAAVRILTINDQPLRLWQDRHGEAERVMYRTQFFFSTRSRLDPSERIVAGDPMREEPWNPDSVRPFAISLEQEFGRRLGVGIGDRLTVDVQGIEMEGQVTNLRKVRWNSFQPNFFMLVQAGVIDEAPKTYLASVSGVAASDRQALINRLSAAFAGISVLDVSRTVAQLTEIATRLTGSLRWMAMLSLAIGLLSVVTIARREALRREAEIDLMRVLGAGAGRIRLLVGLEFALVGLAAALLAMGMSFGCALVVANLVFDSLWRPDIPAGLLLLASAPILSGLTALSSIQGVLGRRPTALLA